MGAGRERQRSRVVSIPPGMTIAEELKVLSGYSRAELERLDADCPEPLAALLDIAFVTDVRIAFRRESGMRALLYVSK